MRHSSLKAGTGRGGDGNIDCDWVVRLKVGSGTAIPHYPDISNPHWRLMHRYGPPAGSANRPLIKSSAETIKRARHGGGYLPSGSLLDAPYLADHSRRAPLSIPQAVSERGRQGGAAQISWVSRR
jgi:hypothetical protein